jgi:[1-hydroxy-2-(trimethylamino)ethyl]phosphonate dioxygenase
VTFESSDEHDFVKVLFHLFESLGHSAYFGEAVSQLEHALQVANLAEREGSPDSLIVSGLLHDVGHLVHDLPENVAESGRDGFHQDEGASWLAPYFGPEVVRPIQLHVDAKRYLCAVEPSYFEALSPASQVSLRLQGGPMSPEEADRFAADAFSQEAVRLRRWDDLAKVPGLEVPSLQHYRDRIESVLRARRERGASLN